tara:strand:- start:27995 stop:28546 length:552 start_codon:yes stop_codon:yes gene_type:complete
MRVLTPLAHTALESGQTGKIMVMFRGTDLLTSHVDGFNGVGTRVYQEHIAGRECGRNTSADNTTGTFFYPEVDFFYSVLSLSRDSLVSAAPPVSLAMGTWITAKAWEPYDGAAKASSHFSRYSAQGVTPGYYPDYLSHLSGQVSFLEVAHGDHIFGKFSRIAIEKSHSGAGDYSIAIIEKGYK